MHAIQFNIIFFFLIIIGCKLLKKKHVKHLKHIFFILLKCTHCFNNINFNLCSISVAVAAIKTSFDHSQE